MRFVFRDSVAEQNRFDLIPLIKIHPLLLHQWLENCLINHPKCHSEVAEEAPNELLTRILDVGDTINSRQTRLLVRNGLRAPYVTITLTLEEKKLILNSRC